MVDRDAPDRVFGRGKQFEVVDGALALVPDLVLLESPPFLLLLHLHIFDVFRLPIGRRRDELVEQEVEGAGGDGKGNDGQGGPVEADAVGLHGHDLLISRQEPEGDQRRQQDAGGHHHGDDGRDRVEVIGHDLSRRCAVAEEHPDPLEEVHQHVQAQESEQDEPEGHEELAGDVAVQNGHGLTRPPFGRGNHRGTISRSRARAK